MQCRTCGGSAEGGVSLLEQDHLLHLISDNLQAQVNLCISESSGVDLAVFTDGSPVPYDDVSAVRQGGWPLAAVPGQDQQLPLEIPTNSRLYGIGR
jgi:hypothetical protein